MHDDRPIPFLPTDRPIPFYPRSAAEMAKSPRFNLKDAADELARLSDIASQTDALIGVLKARILTEIGPLSEPHTELRGRQSLWDVRFLPTTAVCWKKIAEEAQASPVMIAKHTTEKMQVSFKRMPVEVKKS